MPVNIPFPDNLANLANRIIVQEISAASNSNAPPDDLRHAGWRLAPQTQTQDGNKKP